MHSWLINTDLQEGTTIRVYNINTYMPPKHLHMAMSMYLMNIYIAFM
jgi:hypothetical protein